jgi:hypothetical protein
MATYALEARVVNPTSKSFRLGFSKLGAYLLGGTAGTGFIMGVDHLNRASLASSMGYIWKDFTGQCTSIVSKRGSAVSGVCVRGTAGTLTATFKNGGDTDLAINLGVGSQVRLRESVTNHVVWTGVLADTLMQGVKGSKDYRVTWSCVDVMARLGQKVNGVTAQSFAARMTSLASAAGLTTPVPLPNSDVEDLVAPSLAIGSSRYDTLVPLSAVSDSLSIAEHMDMACATVRAMYFPSEDGNLTCSPDWGPGAYAWGVPPFSDDGTFWGSDGIPSYTALSLGLNSAAICNVLNVTNKGTGNSWSMSMGESVARYGRREQSLTVCATNDADAQVVAGDFLRTASESTFTASEFSIPERFVTTFTANPDPLGHPVIIVQAGKKARAWVINEQITIKPKLGLGQSAHYTYQLAPRQLLYYELY